MVLLGQLQHALNAHMKVVCGIDFATPKHVRNMVHPRLVARQFAALVWIREIDIDGYSSLPVSQVGLQQARCVWLRALMAACLILPALSIHHIG
jgi:hypothetical protein